MIVTVAYLALIWTVPERDHPSWVAEAKTTPLLRESATMLEQALPPDWRREGQAAARSAEEATRSADAYRRLSAPRPDAPDGTERRGYEDEQRKALDELIKDKR